MDAVKAISFFYDCLDSLDVKAALMLLLLLLVPLLLLRFCSSSNSPHTAAVATSDIVDDVSLLSSTALLDPKELYDVFISFRGIDTRDGFTSHLHHALCINKISTYIDDRLEKGGEISSELLKAIENSRISIVIFSENYASSWWCLEELEHIIKWEKTIVPVFYRVDPTDVRRQKGNYAASLSKLQGRYGIEKVNSWRSNLTKAANRSGFPSYQIRPESKLVKEIVQDVLNKLKATLPRDLNLDGFFGLEERIKEIESLLCIGSKVVRIIGLWGMPGIGKTTLAKFVFQQIYDQFEAYCFMENVREESENHGQNYIQNKLCSKLLDEENIDTTTPFLDPLVANRLSKKKVLIVFDDVSCPRQLEFLHRNIHFGLGTRIIVTTRDRHVLTNIEANAIFSVQELSQDDALHLFQLRAFRNNSPTMEYEELSKRVINYVDGNPLALTVLGSHLYSRNIKFWESTLNKLQEIPNRDIQKVMQISYDDLEDNVKNIFLDLACFFKGEQVNFVKDIADGCGFFWDEGIELLIEKSLITIDHSNQLWMHDLIQQMGQEVVRQQSINNPERRTRLWRADEIYHVLQNDIGTEVIEGIYFNMSDNRMRLSLRPATFSKMYKLRVLKIYRSNGHAKKCKVYAPTDLQPFPDALRYLHWEEYPLKSLPLRFPENLVALHLPNSHVEQLWDETKISKNMGCSYQCDSEEEEEEEEEEMTLATCSSNQLVSSHLGVYTSQEKLPRIAYTMKSLLYLNVSGCFSLNKFPQLPRNITELNLSGTPIVTVPESIEGLSDLKSFKLMDCKRLETLAGNIYKLKRLEGLYLNRCTKLKTFPEIYEPMEHLRKLVLSESAIQELPSHVEYLIGLTELSLNGCKNLISLPLNIRHLANLHELSIKHCERLKSLPELMSSLLELFADNCTSLEIVPRSTIALMSNKEKQDGYFSEYFRFLNCPKLDPNAYYNIMTDTLLRIYRVAASKSIPHGDDRTYNGYTALHAGYPGNQFPEWIEGEMEGNSLCIEKLPPGRSFSKVLGLVVCAHVAMKHHHCHNEHRAMLDREQRFGASNGWYITLQDSSTFCSNLDHVFISSTPAIKWLPAYDVSQIQVVFNLRSGFGVGDENEVCKYFEVRKCGFKCIYAEELEEFNLANNQNVGVYQPL